LAPDGELIGGAGFMVGAANGARFVWYKDEWLATPPIRGAALLALKR